MSAILTSKGIEHYHEVDNGGHDSIFYLPRFVPSLMYLDEGMYSTEDSADIISGTAEVVAEENKINVTYDAEISDGISEYLNTVIDLNKVVSRDETTGAVSKVTNNLGEGNETSITPDLRIPIEIIVSQDGVKAADITDYQTAGSAVSLSRTISVPADDIDLEAEYTVDVYVSVLENTKRIASITMNAPVYETGIYTADGEDVYYVNGERQYATDVVQVGSVWYNLVNGVVQKKQTVAKNSRGWWYINEKGVVDFSYTGFASNENGDWYVVNGAVRFDQNSVFKDKTGALGTIGTWYYVKGSKVQYVDTVAKNENGWWYIRNGKVDFGYTGYVNVKNIRYSVKNGKVEK